MSNSNDAETTPEGEPVEVAEATEDPGLAEAGTLAAAEAGETDAAVAEAVAEPPSVAALAASDVAAGPFKLHRRARLEETEALLAWLLAAPAAAPMEFDASEVDNVSTPYVLAIVGAARARAEAGSPAAVRSPSPAFVDAFSDLGLFGDLMKMEIRP